MVSIQMAEVRQQEERRRSSCGTGSMVDEAVREGGEGLGEPALVGVGLWRKNNYFLFVIFCSFNLLLSIGKWKDCLY